MRTLTSLLSREVVTESGRSLGRCHDLRGELTGRVGKIMGALGYDTFRWGPGRRGTLLLSDAAGSMGFLMLQGSARGKVGVTATALNAVISMADHHYLAAHRLEFEIAPRWNIGIAEAARYSSDGIDLLYVTGLLPYTVVERIRIREVSNDSLRSLERANVMASADVSFRALRALTLYGELLVDDYATEKPTREPRAGPPVAIWRQSDMLLPTSVCVS